MDTIQIQYAQPDGKVGYRVLPAVIEHPRKAVHLTKSEFEALPKKQKLHSAPSLAKGHAGTDLWYIGSRPDHFYVVQLKFTPRLFIPKPDIYVKSICTFTPTFGADVIDSHLCMIIEEYSLYLELQTPIKRLKLFGSKDEISMLDLLRAIGFPISSKTDNQ
jgi:hypothetical protein